MITEDIESNNKIEILSSGDTDHTDLEEPDVPPRLSEDIQDLKSMEEPHLDYEPEGDLILIPPIKVKSKKKNLSHGSTQIPCLTALTTLILPIQLSSPTTANIVPWVNERLQHTISIDENTNIRMWELKAEFPSEVHDLDSHFRQQMGVFNNYKDKKLLDLDDKDDIWRLQLTSEACEYLFPNVSLVVYSSVEGNFYRL